MPPSFTTRFAPSPTGRLHLGHAYAARAAWTRARESGGRFWLRIEDIDPARCRPEYTAAVVEDLGWLGLDWDGVRIQSGHAPAYHAALRTLHEAGLLYPCFCTRAEIALAAPHGPTPAYPGTCRHRPAADRAERIAAGHPHAWRLDMAEAVRRTGTLSFTDETQGAITANPTAFGDITLARKDAPFSYHLCATHDDALQGITLVTRGVDLLPSTHIHRLLQALMHWPTPNYAHHELICDAAGRRLSKRDGALTLQALRKTGMKQKDLDNLFPLSLRVRAGVRETIGRLLD